MDTPSLPVTTSPAGGYVAVVAVAVGLLSNFGIVIPQSEAIAAVAGIFAIVGIVHILIAHFNLKVAAGLKN